MADPREEQRAWLEKVMAATGLSGTALAQKAGLAQTTITRFMKPDYPHALQAGTVAKIEAATGMAFGPEPQAVAKRASESEPFDPKRVPTVAGEMVRILIGAANGVDPWVLRSRALETAGYLPGDILIVDLNGDPEPGDVVCAQIYDWARSRAETVFRIWEPPYLVASSYDPEFLTPLVVDNRSIMMKGVAVASLRPRRARSKLAA